MRNVVNAKGVGDMFSVINRTHTNMKILNRFSLPFLALVLTMPPAHAAIVFTQVSSTTQYTYVGDVSASDLLHGLTPVTTAWNTSYGASPLELTDGIHGGEVPGDVQGAWTTVGATVEYNLGLSPGGAGWDITSVQSIADWVNVGFGNQAWTLEVKPVGGSYSIAATVGYQPLGGGGGTTKVTLTDTSGVLATGIEFIKVTANQVNNGGNGGAFIWRELDVFGAATPVPEPSAAVLLGGFCALFLLRRRRD